MPFPPETPQDHYDYFYGMQNAIPPNPKWEVGLRVSRSWVEYCKTDDKSKDSQELVSIIKTFLPFRVSGSGFLGLWQQILGHVSELSVGEQKGVWFEVFNSANQGEDKIKHNEEAREILEEWVKLDNVAGTIQINENTITDMVNKIYKYAFSGWEWFAFTRSMSEWFKKYVDQPSLYDLVWSKLGKNSD